MTVTRVNNTLRNLNLAQQMAIIACALCLVIGLALIALAATSSKHMQLEQQDVYGAALAEQIATKVTSALESGDLLSVKASLEHFVETTPAQEAEIFDIEDNPLGQAGSYVGQSPLEYQAQVEIAGDTAGHVQITLGIDQAVAAHRRFVLTLLGLAILLALAAYGAIRHLGQRLSDQLRTLSDEIALEQGTHSSATTANEMLQLKNNIAALPMDLLRARESTASAHENYRTTAVLYLQLSSLVEYVDTFDQHSIQRYTNRLHQIVYGASGFYSGDLRVVRQFGLAVYFGGESPAGSPAFRAASCAWLVRELSAELEKQLPVSMSVAMAISQSELGVGDERDIYPGLYLQHTLDELQGICALKPPNILLSPKVCEDVDIAGRVEYGETELQNYQMLVDFEGPYRDLLERQLRLIWKRLAELSKK
ncbi:MAG: hypothetical protein AB8B81_09080 [Halioglobus sp.]